MPRVRTFDTVVGSSFGLSDEETFADSRPFLQRTHALLHRNHQTMNSRTRLLPVLVLLGSTACATAPLPPPTINPDGAVSVDGLVRMENTEAAYAEARPGYDLTPYTAFILDRVEVSYQKDPRGVRSNSIEANFELSSQQMESFRDAFEDEVVEALTGDGGYDLVTEPGPNVARLSTHLIDLIVRVPTERMNSRERSAVSSYMEVTLILELRDSESGEILIRSGDRRDPTRSTYELAAVNPAWVRRDVTTMFRSWATTMRERLDQIRAVQAGGR